MAVTGAFSSMFIQYHSVEQFLGLLINIGHWAGLAPEGEEVEVAEDYLVRMAWDHLSVLVNDDFLDRSAEYRHSCRVPTLGFVTERRFER